MHRHKKSSLQLVTLSNTVLLLVHTALGHYYGGQFIQRCFVQGFSSVVFVTSITLLESIVIVPVQLSYIVQVRVFNLTRPSPDAQQSANDLSLEVCPNEEYSVNDSFKSVTDPKEFIQLQSAMISKLREEKAQLRARIREARNMVELAPNQSLNYSLAEQSIMGGF